MSCGYSLRLRDVSEVGKGGVADTLEAVQDGESILNGKTPAIVQPRRSQGSWIKNLELDV